ncbi:MAG: zf-HC2 protein [Frankiales bacterium]|nr:zf-HC2 protein [Frankiales bacterium]
MSDRVCNEVQAELPAYVDRSLSAFRRNLIALHLRRCSACQAEFSLQRDLHDGLRSLATTDDTPPDGLLESLLQHADSPRGAAPLRGAVSGAKPVYSAALLLAGAASAAGAGYASWLSAKHVRARFRR